MITKTIPAPLPARYVWDGAVSGTTDIDCKTIDPSGQLTPSNAKHHPAIGLMVAHAGTVLYTDSMGKNLVITCLASVYYQGDFAKILHTGKAYDAAAAADTATITPTAHSITLYWDL